MYRTQRPSSLLQDVVQAFRPPAVQSRDSQLCRSLTLDTFSISVTQPQFPHLSEG